VICETVCKTWQNFLVTTDLFDCWWDFLRHDYGLATMSRLLKIIGFFCTRSPSYYGSLLQRALFKRPYSDYILLWQNSRVTDSWDCWWDVTEQNCFLSDVTQLFWRVRLFVSRDTSDRTHLWELTCENSLVRLWDVGGWGRHPRKQQDKMFVPLSKKDKNKKSNERWT